MRQAWGALLLAGAATAPLAAPAAVHAQPAASQAGVVTPYPAAFFAEYRPRTAADMLGRLPAFSIDDGDGGRGLGQGGNVLIDGERPTSKSDSLGDILGRLQASSIERIDLIQGSAPGVDMQGYSVVANVIRRKDSGLKGSVAGHVFSTGGHGGYQIEGQAQKSVGEHKFSGSFEIRPAADPFNRSTRVRRDPNGDVILHTLRSSLEHGRDYEATVAYEGPAGPGRVRATLVGELGDEEERTVELDLSGAGAPDRLDAGGGSYHHGEINLGYIWPTALGEAELAVVAQQDRDESDDFSGASTFSQIRDSSEVVGLAALRLAPMGRWTLNGGVEVAYNSLDTVSVLSAPGQTLVNPAIVVEELRGEAFGAARFAASPRLNLEFGLRYEVSNISTVGAAGKREKTLSFPKPRVTATFARSPAEQISLRLERTVDQLSFGDFSATVSLTNGSAPISGNPALEPGKAWIGEARYERRFGKQGSFAVTLAHEAKEDLILTHVFLIGPAPAFPQPLPPGTYYEAADNVGDGYRSSLDIDTTLPLDRIGLLGGLFTLNLDADRTRLTDPTTGERREFSGQSPWGAGFTLSQDIAAWGLRWEIKGSTRENYDGFRPTESSFWDGEATFSVAVEKTTGPYWIRTGFNNAGGVRSRTLRTVYNNPRGRGAVRFVETREDYQTPFFYFLVRRTF
jgi:hypothetical protein